MDGFRHLKEDLTRAGYYPELAVDVISIALAQEPVVSHLVHLETTFDHTTVRRHISVLALTNSRIVLAHIDDVGDGESAADAAAAATTESIPLRRINSVGLTHGINNPEDYQPGNSRSEITLAIAWGQMRRYEMEPAHCGDPQCEVDHGYIGSSMPDDLVLRFSAIADGEEAVNQVLDFAAQLSLRTAQI